MLKILCRGKTVRCELYGCRAHSILCQHAMHWSHRYLGASLLEPVGLASKTRHTVLVLQPWLLGSCMRPEKVAAA